MIIFKTLFAVVVLILRLALRVIFHTPIPVALAVLVAGRRVSESVRSKPPLSLVISENTIHSDGDSPSISVTGAALSRANISNNHLKSKGL